MSKEKTDHRFKSLIENSPNGIATVNKIGIITFCNPTFLKLTGYPEDEIVGKHISRLPTIQKKDIPRYLKLVISAFKGSNLPEIEFEYITKSKEIRFGKAILSLVKKDGKVIELMLILRDVTDEKNTEKVILSERNKFKSLIDGLTAADIGIDIVGLDYKIYYQNKLLEDAFGKLSGGELCYKTYKGFKEPCEDCNIDKALKEKKPFSREERGSDNKIYNVLSAPIPYYDGKGDKVIEVITDITEKKNTELKIKDSYTKLQKTFDDTIKTLASILETRDPYTSGHQKRVSQLAIGISEEIGLTKEKIEAIKTAALLHDIGKINIPASILARPGKISDIEYEMIKTHSQLGYDILKNIEFPWPVADFILQHHEKEDGSGYPNGLKGKDISVEAKILLVADVIEAMSSHRPYRPALGMDKALMEIKKNKGKLYDPKVVDACIELFKNKDFKFTD